MEGILVARGTLLSVHDGGVALGDPRAQPVLLGPTHLISVASRASVPWRDVRSADLELPVGGTAVRAWSWVRGLALATVADHVGDSAALSLEIETSEGRVALEARCHTTAGYPAAEVRAVEALLRRFVDEPAARNELRDPKGVVDTLRADVKSAWRAAPS